jgi:hypothetical protein
MRLDRLITQARKRHQRNPNAMIAGTPQAVHAPDALVGMSRTAGSTLKKTYAKPTSGTRSGVRTKLRTRRKKLIGSTVARWRAAQSAHNGTRRDVTESQR